MVTQPPADLPPPLGRDAEIAALERFLAALVDGRGPAALLLLGEAGIGKTTLLLRAGTLAEAHGCRVLRAAPARAEQGLAYAVLADLMRDVEPGVLDDLPAPQRRALRVATLEEDAGAGQVEPRTIAAALLSVFRRLAGTQPLVVEIDDAQWIDRGSAAALEFALRRLERLPAGVLLAARGKADEPAPLGLAGALPADRLTRLAVRPLTVAALFQLLRERLGHPFERPALLRITEWSGGNPLFALEIARTIRASGRQLEPGAPPPVSRDLSEALGDRIRSLPMEERRTLALAASASRPTIDLVRAACRRLRWPMRLPGEPGLLEANGPELRFAHPLFAAEALAVASADDRRAAHRALAALAGEPEERARHLALAANGPDAAVADALEAAADRARARGAPDGAAEFEELACRLTPPDARDAMLRRRRQFAELLVRLGANDRAREELETVVAGGPPGSQRALALATLARLVRQQKGPTEATGLCRRALEEAGDDRLVRARVELAWSVVAADAAERLAHAQSALAMLTAGPPHLRARALIEIAGAESSLGRPAPYALLDEAVELEEREPPERLTDGAALERAHQLLMDDELERAHAEYDALRRAAEVQGDESSLAWVLIELAQIDLRAGRWDETARHAAEAFTTAERCGLERDQALAEIQLGALAAARGDRPAAERSLRYAGEYAERNGEPFVASLVAGNLGALALSEGDPGAAEHLFAEAEDRLLASNQLDAALSRFYGDRLEALAALGDLRRATALADDLERRAQANGRRRPLAFVARGRGIVAAADGDLDAALEALDRSVRVLDDLGMRFETARSLLARGIVHRRRREKRLADADLRRALGTFQELGATAWAKRAGDELGRIGLRPRAAGHLTETERTVARLAADGRTNREIAALAFMSPRTVEGVLARAYSKLGVGSRAELGREMARLEPGGVSGGD